MAFPLRSRVILAFVVFLYAVGAAGHLVAVLRPAMLALTPWFLLGAGALVAWAASRTGDLRSLALWFVPVFLATFGLEALGVATGAVFGPYHYTPVLGTLLLGVPPVIGWNWVLVVLGAHTAVRALVPRTPEAVRIVLVGLVCVAFDLLLEPVAIGLGYWVWDGGAVPMQNYLAWGLIAAGAGWWAGRFPRLPSDPLLGCYLVLQALFFAFLQGAGALG